MEKRKGGGGNYGPFEAAGKGRRAGFGVWEAVASLSYPLPILYSIKGREMNERTTNERPGISIIGITYSYRGRVTGAA